MSRVTLGFCASGPALVPVTAAAGYRPLRLRQSGVRCRDRASVAWLRDNPDSAAGRTNTMVHRNRCTKQRRPGFLQRNARGSFQVREKSAAARAGAPVPLKRGPVGAPPGGSASPGTNTGPAARSGREERALRRVNHPPPAKKRCLARDNNAAGPGLRMHSRVLRLA
ncbi:hypothetical protein SKAU_G00349230 [Synaphobranchus kaupii]|uniref:Uncharacterized protein n=1 Tax=Synaphobranchus kaupii TaxID=118154 RepID=A0A9Q1IH23_SYNKA|nr:hypothetical protein SKAU_G00349230 [Synaphobranchus kaupii]